MSFVLVDVVAANFFGGTISVFLGQGSGVLSSQVSYDGGTSPAGVAIGDFNGLGFGSYFVSSLFFIILNKNTNFFVFIILNQNTKVTLSLQISEDLHHISESF